jgi:Protein of unknown function (DUF3108)
VLVGAAAFSVVLGACGRREGSAARQGATGASAAESVSVAPPDVSDTTARPGGPADTAVATAPGATTGARSGTGPAVRPPHAAPPASVAASPSARAVPARIDTTARVDTAVPTPAAAAPAGPPPIPRRAFNVGERLTYEVRFGPVRVGEASMEVLGVEQLRGHDAYHTRFLLRGGTVFYRVNDRYESWFDARTLESLRYVQQIDQGSYERERVFEIFPDRRTYTEGATNEQKPSVAEPLDDGSFLYFLRSIPLEVGKTYEFNRYFRPDRNPVRVTVLRREPVQIPAGTFDAIVVQPTIKTTGIFSEGGRAEVWFAADSTRRMLQMKSRLSFGSLNLYLKRVE